MPPRVRATTLLHPHLLSPPLHHLRLSSTLPTPQDPQPYTHLLTRSIPAPHCGHIRILTLNSPHNRNAISKQLLSELSTEINSIKNQTDEEEARYLRWRDSGGGKKKKNGDGGEERPAVGQGTRVLILTSALDNVFCAGADLKERRGMSQLETTTFLTSLRRTLHTLSALPLPTLSLIAAPALGGGFELALATSTRFCTPSATFGLPETRLGIIPGAGGCWRLGQLIGKSRAGEMVVSGRRVGGEEAGRVGIVERVVDCGDGDSGDGIGGRERLLEAGVEWARGVCEGAPGAVGAGLRAVGVGTEAGERREYERVVGMRDRDEALVAFGEKRGAVFRGV